MRTISATLDAAQNSRNRFPLARATVRKMRLSFSHFATITNPWSLSDTAQQGSQSYVYGDSVTYDNGTVLRVWADQSGNMRLQTISSPGTAANWSHATNPWSDLGVAPNTGVGIANQGLVATGNTARLFYDSSVSEDGGIGLHYRDSSTSFATPHWTGLNFFGTPCYAPTSTTEVFAFLTDYLGQTNQLGLLRIGYNGSIWTSEEAPFRVLGDKDHTIYSGEYNSITYFDAFVLNGVSHIVYTFGDAGHSYVVRYQNGVWSEPRILLVADATKFVCYRVSVINGMAFATGRLTRANDPNFSPAFDCYLYSKDGWNWTALARNSFLTENELRGKLLLSGSKVYYAGLANVWQSDATYFLGVDDSAKKLLLDDRLVHVGQSFPAAGLAPTTQLDIGNSDNFLPVDQDGDAILDYGSEIWVEAGYKTTAQPVNGEYVALSHSSIDSLQVGQSDGQRELQVNARSANVKALHDWTSPFYWPLLSQIRYFDPCNNTDTLNMVRGEWSTASDNMCPNPSFETNARDGYDVASGTATGTRDYVTEQSSAGNRSFKLVKLSGGATDLWGTETPVDCLAGQVYHAEADVYVTAISGGNLGWRMRLQAQDGMGGSVVEEYANNSDVTLSFVTLQLDITPLVDGVLRLFVEFYDCLTGTMYLDNLHYVQVSIGHLRFQDQSETGGILLSTTPFSAGDFDIQSKFTLTQTVAPHIALFGLISHWSDENNYLTLNLSYPGNLLVLAQVRGGFRSRLTTAAVTITPGTQYDIRLVHRGGHFLAYVKASSTYNWLNPLIDYHWGNSTLCKTDDGRGSVGLFTLIRSYRFIAAEADELATTITASSVGDLAAMSASGTVVWEDEHISYTANSGTELSGCVRGVDGTKASSHSAGLVVNQFSDAEIEIDDFQYSDTEPNYSTEAMIQRVSAMSGVLDTQFQSLYPRYGTADPTTITTADGGFNVLATFLPTAIDTKNVDLTFDWTATHWADASTFVKVGAMVRCDTTSLATARGYFVHLGYLAAFGADRSLDTYWAGLWYLDGAGNFLQQDQIQLLQRPTGSGPHRGRIIARDDFFCIYSDDALLGTFHDTRYSANTLNYVGVAATNGGATFDNIRIAELHEWRESARVDNDGTAQGALQSIVIDDRPVYMVVRPDDTLYFSLFETRDQLVGPNMGGTFSDIVYTDQANPQDVDLATFMRIYAVTIMESVDPALARKHGLVFSARQMQRAQNLWAGLQFPKLFRRQKELHGNRSQEMWAHLGFEIEDGFSVSLTPAGSSVPIVQDLIVNDLTYDFQPANFNMRLGIRTKAT